MGPFDIDSQRQLRVCDQFDMGIDAIILDLCLLNYEISTSRSINLGWMSTWHAWMAWYYVFAMVMGRHVCMEMGSQLTVVLNTWLIELTSMVQTTCLLRVFAMGVWFENQRSELSWLEFCDTFMNVEIT